MKTSEKVLYHQIHPLKLLTDIVSSPISLYYLWIHQLALGLAIHYLPALVVSALMVRFLDFQRQKESAFGRYVARYMTNSLQLLRFIGDVVTVIGAWYQLVWLIVAGLIVVLAAWLRGFILPDKPRQTAP